MSTIETTGKTIEDAVRSGLVRLGRMKDEVDIEVLEEPKSGFFGFGSKPAKVRITEKEGVPVVPAMESQLEEAEKTAAPEAAEPAVRVEAESLPQKLLKKPSRQKKQRLRPRPSSRKSSRTWASTLSSKR